MFPAARPDHPAPTSPVGPAAAGAGAAPRAQAAARPVRAELCDAARFLEHEAAFRDLAAAAPEW